MRIEEKGLGDWGEKGGVGGGGVRYVDMGDFA